jgi:type III restriction enzyme
VPDFIVRMKGDGPRHLILETKGYDPRQEKKAEAAERWVRAVNADGRYGQWAYGLVKKPEDVVTVLAARAR